MGGPATPIVVMSELPESDESTFRLASGEELVLPGDLVPDLGAVQPEGRVILGVEHYFADL